MVVDLLIVAHRVQDQLNTMQWDLLKHPACSPSLLLCGVHVLYNKRNPSEAVHSYVQEAAVPWCRQQHKELSQHFEEEKKSLISAKN